MCIENDITLLLARVLMGYLCGLLRPTAQTLLFQLTPPELRNKSMTIYAMHFTIGFFVCLLWGYADNEGKYVWRISLLFQVIPCLLFIIISLTIYKKFDSPVNLLREKKENQVKEIMAYYMKESQIIFMINNSCKVIETEDELLKSTKGRRCGAFRFLITYYNKEFQYGIVLGLCTALNMFNCYFQFIQILLQKDENDKDE